VAWQWQDGSGDILTIKYFLKKVWHGSGTGGSGKINNQIFQSIFVVNCVNFGILDTERYIKTHFTPKKHHFSSKNA
jgi:hypothetical protein